MLGTARVSLAAPFFTAHSRCSPGEGVAGVLPCTAAWQRWHSCSSGLCCTCTSRCVLPLPPLSALLASSLWVYGSQEPCACPCRLCPPDTAWLRGTAPVALLLQLSLAGKRPWLCAGEGILAAGRAGCTQSSSLKAQGWPPPSQPPERPSRLAASAALVQPSCCSEPMGQHHQCHPCRCSQLQACGLALLCRCLTPPRTCLVAAWVHVGQHSVQKGLPSHH